MWADRRLSRIDVGRAGALGTLLRIEGYFLAFCQRLEATALDGAVVDENVGAAVFGADETETLAVIEPLDRACSSHNCLPVN
jgi:hypothetical protein